MGMCSLSGQEELRRDPIHSADVGSIMAAQQFQPHGLRLDNIIEINPDVKILPGGLNSFNHKLQYSDCGKGCPPSPNLRVNVCCDKIRQNNA